MLRYFTIIFSFFFFCSCSNVVITRDYIYSTTYGKEEGNGIGSIKKIYFDKNLGSIENIDVDAISVNYKVDTSFCYSFYSPDAKTKRIYFNEKNDGGQFRRLCYKDLSTTYDTIGQLETDTWYRIEGIRYRLVYYAYIDPEGKTHTWEKFLSW